MLRALPLALVAFALLAPSAHAKSCGLSKAEQGGSKPSTLGPTYVNGLSAKKTSCGKAKGVVKAYHACRGSKTSCSKKVKGYSCAQKKLDSSPIQYQARVTCSKGAKRVTHVYSQNT